jgi:hypothetical protein
MSIWVSSRVTEAARVAAGRAAAAIPLFWGIFPVPPAFIDQGHSTGPPHEREETVTMIRLSLLTAVLALSACGSTQEQRALSGGAIGAGAGAVGSALVGGSVLGGAIIGGAAGAATGLLTDRDVIDLGEFPDD